MSLLRGEFTKHTEAHARYQAGKAVRTMTAQLLPRGHPVDGHPVDQRLLFLFTMVCALLRGGELDGPVCVMRNTEASSFRRVEITDRVVSL